MKALWANALDTAIRRERAPTARAARRTANKARPAHTRGEIERLLAKGALRNGKIRDLAVSIKDAGELEAYLVCKWAGWEIVPETAASPHGVLQRSVKSVELFQLGIFPGIVYLRSRGAHVEDLPRMAALDLILGKAQCQCALDLSVPIRRRIYALSNHGGGDTTQNTLVRYFAGLPIPGRVHEEVRGLARNLCQENVIKTLRREIGAPRAEVIKARILELAGMRDFPSSLQNGVG